MTTSFKFSIDCGKEAYYLSLKGRVKKRKRKLLWQLFWLQGKMNSTKQSYQNETAAQVGNEFPTPRWSKHWLGSLDGVGTEYWKSWKGLLLRCNGGSASSNDDRNGDRPTKHRIIQNLRQEGKLTLQAPLFYILVLKYSIRGLMVYLTSRKPTFHQIDLNCQ